MKQRHAHLVGSIPFKDERTAMTKAIKYLSNSLRSLPDGEIGKKSRRHKLGERLGWIQWVVESLGETPAFTLVKKPSFETRLGLWADYRSGLRYRLNVPRPELYRYLDFGYPQYFKKSYMIFQSLKKKHKLKKLRFQFGIPGALDLSLFSLGFINGYRARTAIEDRLAYEVNAMHEIAGDDVLFQIEVPVELGLFLKLPAIVKPLAVRVAVKNIISLVNKIDREAALGIHLCLGDLNNKPFSRIRSAAPLVAFSNELVRQWPRDRTLEFIHYPLAMADIPPSLNPRFYKPMKRLDLPKKTRFIAGFVHEGLGDEEHAEILSVIESFLGRRADVSSSCGLGRRTPETAELILKKTAKLISSMEKEER
jgi:hypothetical protein